MSEANPVFVACWRILARREKSGRNPLTEAEKTERAAAVNRVLETKQRLGITEKQACAREGVDYSNFRRWKKRIAQ